ncbi:uncharacterized protein LOC9629616 [Selaginella moellendorffii]|uniref:uncharacterized protein LOC9629616 n=1 Tax=Selaginella moellendorffii TaxID=88036 RepID=UPI000D1CDA8E|nr:uncharacterized protein LOC9629616 [Selaginella moellendorffii]|eukprot:XP_024536142.1 uncharacterized protein LOC9629616 [Selaginella moellendorffii]
MESSPTELLDLPSDPLLLCAGSLDLRDLSHLAMSCKRLRQIAYADPLWERQCRIRWPAKQTTSGLFEFLGGRDDYLGRLIACQQFRFRDPFEWKLSLPTMVKQILIHEDAIVAARGSEVLVVMLSSSGLKVLNDHSARINCMRLFPVGGLRNYFIGDNILATCSADHTIRIWGKGRSLRTLRGHSDGVSVIADRLLGQATVIASGGMDSTVKLWNFNGGRTPLLTTLYGHESYIKDLAVAGHNPCIMVSGAKDSKLRVWDTNTATCVGAAKGPASLTSLKSFQSICYASGGSTVAALDLRTMKTVATIDHPGGICATALSSSGKLLCTGGNDRTCKLWDTRSNHQALAELCGHDSPVHFLHLDDVKVVTAGPDDTVVNVWDSNHGTLVSSFDQGSCTTALASQGPRLAIATSSSTTRLLSYRDFSNCTESTDQAAGSESSKFWDM